jgi:hypothetical protein
MQANQIIFAEIEKFINKAITKVKESETGDYARVSNIIQFMDDKNHRFDFEKMKLRCVKSFLKELAVELGKDEK